MKQTTLTYRCLLCDFYCCKPTVKNHKIKPQNHLLYLCAVEGGKGGKTCTEANRMHFSGQIRQDISLPIRLRKEDGGFQGKGGIPLSLSFELFFFFEKIKLHPKRPVLLLELLKKNALRSGDSTIFSWSLCHSIN